MCVQQVPLFFMLEKPEVPKLGGFSSCLTTEKFSSARLYILCGFFIPQDTSEQGVGSCAERRARRPPKSAWNNTWFFICSGCLFSTSLNCYKTIDRSQVSSKLSGMPCKNAPNPGLSRSTIYFPLCISLNPKNREASCTSVSWISIYISFEDKSLLCVFALSVRFGIFQPSFSHFYSFSSVKRNSRDRRKLVYFYYFEHQRIPWANKSNSFASIILVRTGPFSFSYFCPIYEHFIPFICSLILLTALD